MLHIKVETHLCRGFSLSPSSSSYYLLNAYYVPHIILRALSILFYLILTLFLKVRAIITSRIIIEAEPEAQGK